VQVFHRPSTLQIPAIWHALVRHSACWKGAASEKDTASRAGDAQCGLVQLCTGSPVGGYLVPMVRNVKDMLLEHDRLGRMGEAYTTDA
jgi:hypothetical protein